MTSREARSRRAWRGLHGRRGLATLKELLRLFYLSCDVKLKIPSFSIRLPSYKAVDTIYSRENNENTSDHDDKM